MPTQLSTTNSTATIVNITITVVNILLTGLSLFREYYAKNRLTVVSQASLSEPSTQLSIATLSVWVAGRWSMLAHRFPNSALFRSGSVLFTALFIFILFDIYPKMSTSNLVFFFFGTWSSWMMARVSEGHEKGLFSWWTHKWLMLAFTFSTYWTLLKSIPLTTALPFLQEAVEAKIEEKLDIAQTAVKALIPLVQASLESDSYPVDDVSDSPYPVWLKKNPLHRLAYDVLPLDSEARRVKKAFNSHYFKFCEVCQFSVFSFQHEDRCSPRVLVQSTLPNAPSPLANFDRYVRDDLTGQSPSGAFQRIDRIRSDVRFIEEKVDQMRPILDTIRNQTAGTTSGPTPGGSGTVSTSLANPTAIQGIPADPPASPLGDGGFPSTLEGQMARILYNLRLQAATAGVRFQASIGPLDEPDKDGGQYFIHSNQAEVNNAWRVQVSLEQLMIARGLMDIRPDPRMAVFPPHTNRASNDFSNMLRTIVLNYNRMIPVLLASVGGSATTTPPPSITADPASGNQMQLVQRLVRNLKIHMDAAGTVFVQASLDVAVGNASMVIADTDQVLEPAKEVVRADAPMEEQLNELDTWTIRNVLSRPTLIAREVWSTQNRSEELIGASFPNQWLSNLGHNVHFNNMLNAFTMMKANVVFRLVSNTTPMYGGILAMAFDFYGRLHDVAVNTQGTKRILDSATVSNCDPVYLDLSQGTVVELSVPFSAVSQYLSRQHAPFASQFMGTVLVQTMSRLYKPDTAPNVEIRLYAYVEQPEVALLQEPDSRPFVVPQASIVKTITSFAHSFIPRMQDVYPLALEEGYHVKRENTCRAEEVGSVYGLVKTFDWQTTTLDGAELAKIAVHPMVRLKIRDSPKPVTQATRIGHLARHFSYWNGTLEYKIQVACSASHAGKLYVIFDSGPAYAGGDVTETNAHILLDVQKQHELEFSVPFASPTPWKPTYLYQPFGDINICKTGSIRIVSADGIKSALSTLSNITVNVYMRAGKDFQFAVPRNGLQGESNLGNVIAQTSLTSLRPKLKMNSEDFNDMYKVLRRFTPLGVPPRTINAEGLVIPVRPIMPRYHHDNSISEVASGFAFWRGSLSYKFKVVDVTSNRASFEIFHVPTMGIPAGMQEKDFFKFVPLDDLLDRNTSGSFYGSQAFHGDIDKEWEVTVPYYSMYDHLHLPLTHHKGGADQSAKLPLLSTSNGCLVVRPLQGKDDQSKRAYSLAVSISCGPDFTLLAPSSFPPIVQEADEHLGSNIKVVAQASLDNADPQGLFSVFDDISKAMQNLERLTTTLNEDVDDDSKNYVASILEDVVKRLLSSAKLSVSGWLKDLLPDVDWKLFVSASFAAFVLYKFKDVDSVLLKLVTVGLTSIVSHKVLSKLSDYISSWANPQISAQYGAGFDLQLITQLCCGVIAVLLNLDFKKGITGLVKNIGDFGKNLSGIKQGTDAIRVFSQFVSENIVPAISDEDGMTLKGLMSDSVEILEEVYTLNLEEMKVACFTQEAIKSRVLKCDGRLQELNRLLLMNPCGPSINIAITKAMEKMSKLRTEVMQYKGEDGYRLDPFHISIYGPPKIGKSAMMNKLSDDLILYNGLPTANKVYTRSPENVYWDNYKGQTTVIFDDLGQIAAQAPPSDLSELISLKSNAPYMVHMASLAEKGTYFTSKFIISSTNFKLYEECSYIKSKDALHRRRDVLVEMQPKVINPETRLMPGEQFARGLEGQDSYADFWILDSVTGNRTTDAMSYDELVVILCERAKNHLDTQQSLIDRNSRQTNASAVIQAILDRRNIQIPVVVLGEEVHVVDADAQAFLDGCNEQDRLYWLATWKQSFLDAWKWRDFGAITSGLSPLSQSRIVRAIHAGQEERYDPLNRYEKKIFALWQMSRSVQKRSADSLVKMREGINTVGQHFNGLWLDLPKDKRKMISTALVSLGALAVGTSLYVAWQRTTRPEKSNIPLELFVEGSDDYKSKDRGQPLRKNVVLETSSPRNIRGKERIEAQPESGIDDFKTSRGGRKIRVESGIDDFKTKRGARKIIVEGAADFVEWSAKNPGLIPYRFNIIEEEDQVRVVENPRWNDFEEYCAEQGHKRLWTLPKNAPGYTGPTLLERAVDFFSGNAVVAESGIDDFKTQRSKHRKVVMEADMPNAMTYDVPPKFFEMTEEALVAQLNFLGTTEGKNINMVETDTTAYRVIDAAPQYTEDTQCISLMRTRLIDNVGLVCHKKSSFRMRCVAVDDRFIVLPKHFFLLKQANWQEGDEFSIWIRGRLYTQSFHRPHLLLWESRDLCIYQLSARVSGARSILSFIADRATHSSYRATDGSLFSVNGERDGNVYFERHHLTTVARMTEADHERVQYQIGGNTHILKGYSYSADTVNGDCGSILTQHNVRQNRKILGLHVAAQTGITRAFSELLVAEEIEERMNTLIARTGYITTGSVLQTIELAKRHEVMVQGSIPNQFANLHPNIDIIGALPRNMVKRTPEKSEIIPSPLQGKIDIEPKTEPAPLTVKDPRCLSGIDPLIFQVGGYGLETKPFPVEHLKIITEHQINKLRKYDGFINRRTLSIKEAINGIEGVDYADAMNMNSAEGSFWNLSRPFWAHNKSWMFENIAEEGQRANYVINRESGLLEKLVHRILEAREGRRVLSTSSECLKDERRPFKKTRPPPGMSEEDAKNFTPGTRSFTILPVDYNIAVRQYFWDFAAMIMKNRGELPAQVGIDPCSIEWTGLIKRLLATSNRGFAGDYKNYDRQTCAEFMDVACDIINGWYDDGPINAQIRKILMGEAFDHLSIVRGVFIHIDKGLPSGFPLTVIVNCLNNETYKYCSWLALAPPHLITLDKCDELVDSAFYGDDNMHAIDAQASSFFNMQTVGRHLESHGVEYTDEHKNNWKTAPAMVDIESCSFLKRNFVKHPDHGFYLAPLEKRSIEDRLLWITDSKFMSPEELLKENIQNSLRDAFHWGPGYFLELKNKIADGLKNAYPEIEQQRRLMADITFGGEEYRWAQTCKFMDQLNTHPLLKDVFGF